MSLDNYKNRVAGTIGTSLKDYVKTQVRSNLDTFLEKSQYGMDVKINGEDKRIGIMTGSMTDTRDEVLVLSKLNVLQMGTLFEWDNEFWIVVKREARVIKESFYGTAYRCNVDLKWVDKNGILHSQKAYAKGRGLSSILVENKYTEPPVMSRDVDTPITVITQRNSVFEQDMRFLFEGQPYRVTFVDNLSTDGATILGMYDDILHDGDDTVNNIADYNNHYSIIMDDIDLVGEINVPYTVSCTVLNEGIVDNTKTVVLSGDPTKIRIEEMTITPLVGDDITVTASLDQNELINITFVIHAGEEWSSDDNIFIVGPDTIAWNSSVTYRLNNNADAEFNADMSAAPKVRETITRTDNSITIAVKDKYSGTIHLTAITAGIETIEKDIEVVSMEV